MSGVTNYIISAEFFLQVTFCNMKAYILSKIMEKNE